MSSTNVVRLFVENRSEELIAQSVFADYVRDGRLTVKMCWTASSAISLAESWLLTTPAAAVALALNCSADPREFRTPIENILSRAAARDRWQVAVAVPDMSAWLLSDPKFAESVRNSLAPSQSPSKADIAVFFKDWVKQPGNQFDREEVGRNDSEFAALNGFIERQILSAAGTTE